jgi:glycosyltransferase involved in cell wall biosynthesis
MEAMSAGIPVVATDIPGNRDLVVDGETGWLVPVGDAAGFAGRTNQLLDDPQQAAQVGAAAKDRMLNEFSVELMIQRYEAFYTELMAS